MLEPSLAFQTAVRSSLISDPAVVALVAPEAIRAGGKPTTSPCIVLGDAQAQLLGRVAGGQHVARVSLAVHVWAIEVVADTARAIGFALIRCLAHAPVMDSGVEIDAYTPLHFVWISDPEPDAAWAHGILELEAVIRWRD